MSTTQQPGVPIVIGTVWRQRLTLTALAVPFPVGVVLIGQMRRRTPDTAALATLRTADATIARVSDATVDLTLSAAVTATLAPGTVVFDMIRTDTSEPLYLGFRLTIPVLQPVTRSLA